MQSVTQSMMWSIGISLSHASHTHTDRYTPNREEGRQVRGEETTEKRERDRGISLDKD